MRIESHRHRGCLMFFGTAHNLTQDCPMSAMYAIKVADADHGRFQAGHSIEIAKYAHGLNLELQLQSVMRQPHMIGQRLIGFLMRQVV